MYQVNQIVDYLLTKASMSPKKLQKLLYYSYGWTLALLNDKVDDLHFKLFEEKIEAWVHGPVIPSVYRTFKSRIWEDIPRRNGNTTEFPPEVADILDQVWQVYGSYNGNQLENMTHKEDPWIQARGTLPPYEACDTPLSDEVMFKYFNQVPS